MAIGDRKVDRFEKIELIGEGTYSQVYKAKRIGTGEIVTVKKFRRDGDTIPDSVLRETTILTSLKHENIVHLKKTVISSGKEEEEEEKYIGGTYMVLEYMDHDLAELAKRPQVKFSVPQIKCYMKQLLTGLEFCHANQVIHRDIKGENILLDNKGNLKIADFGLAKITSEDDTQHLDNSPEIAKLSTNENTCQLLCSETILDEPVTKKFTNEVGTLCYKAPELLLGATNYGPEIDIWSLGCVFAELLIGKPIFPGETEVDQLFRIFKLCGSPDGLNWPGVAELPLFYKVKPTFSLERSVREKYKHFDGDALELLDRMLVLNPSQRISAKDALDAAYFSNEPLPSDPKSLPSYESSHDLKIKQKQQQIREEEADKEEKLQPPM